MSEGMMKGIRLVLALGVAVGIYFVLSAVGSPEWMALMWSGAFALTAIVATITGFESNPWD